MNRKVIINPYLDYVRTLLRAKKEARNTPLASAAMPARVKVVPGAPKVLLFSPHPDDECIVGGLALRLLRECGWQVVNVAVTLGSKKDRRKARLEELKRACEFLQFDLANPIPEGMNNVTLEGRGDAPEWQRKVDIIRDIIDVHKPRAIFVHGTHEKNGTHVGTHYLVMDALRNLPEFSCWGVITEFWGEIPKPNLMVEIPPLILADMITALSYHVGEVERNPYHLTLPAWMANSVRMGAETVGAQGGKAPEMDFATLYGIAQLRGGYQVGDKPIPGRILTASESPDTLFPPLT